MKYTIFVLTLALFAINTNMVLADPPTYTEQTPIERQYINIVIDQIENNANSPSNIGDLKGLWGEAIIDIEIAPNGNLISTILVKSSKKDKLDQIFLNMVKVSAPFEPLPPEIVNLIKSKEQTNYVTRRIFKFINPEKLKHE